MSFRDFSYPAVCQLLGLSLVQADLFQSVPELNPGPDLTRRVAIGVRLALDIHTEKARSEFIVAPILIELSLRFEGEFSLFSGVPLDVDPNRGLNGVCDFLISRSTNQTVPTAPLLALAEAKNDSPRDGFGQCIASMVAMRDFNERYNQPIPEVFGAATSGVLWRFAKLSGNEVAVDRIEYPVANLGKILGILASIVRRPQ